MSFIASKSVIVSLAGPGTVTSPLPVITDVAANLPASPMYPHLQIAASVGVGGTVDVSFDTTTGGYTCRIYSGDKMVIAIPSGAVNVIVVMSAAGTAIITYGRDNG